MKPQIHLLLDMKTLKTMVLCLWTAMISLTALPQETQAHCDHKACPVCGDGILGPGEECDDGNTVTEDCPPGESPCTVCASDCTLQARPTAFCPDGILDPASEDCDDGNSNNNDACKNDCTLNICGDGVVETGAEACDDGNAVGGDGCSANCTLEPLCGNGTVETGEDCDDGNSNNGDDCEADCTLPSCGNGILDQGEACDDGNTSDGDGCSANCTQEPPSPQCGDGIVNDGEDCDDGNSNDNDACKNNCTLNVCGDGVVGPGEECDDGNENNEDDCRDDCTPTEDDCPEEPGIPECDLEHKALICHIPPGNPGNAHTICVAKQAVPAHLAHGDTEGACAEECPGEAECGNGTVDEGEECDDSNESEEDDCLNDCTKPECVEEEIPECNHKHKMLICHTPSDKGEKDHTICISKFAVPAHLLHGDYVGVCESRCDDEGTDEKSIGVAGSQNDDTEEADSLSSLGGSSSGGGCSLATDEGATTLFVAGLWVLFAATLSFQLIWRNK